MKPSLPYDQRRIAKACGQWLSQQDFNVAATVTLCQGKRYEADHGNGWRSGDRILYEGLYKSLLNRLSRAVYGRRAYESGSRLANAGAIEGDGAIVSHHLHISLERPEWMPFDKFRLLIEDTWRQSPWVKPDLKVEEIHGCWAYYITKEGPGALLLA